jgi:hypothetical protein
MAGRVQVKSVAGVTIVTVLFAVSFAASAGATVLVSSGGGESTVSASEPTPSPTPSPTRTPTPSATPSATATPTPEPKPSPSTATKRQIKQATDTLCDADLGGLPTLSAAKADPRWARVFEVHLFKQDINPGPIDGDFDARTVAGAKDLQRSLGVADTGKVGEATWNALWNDQCYVAPAPSTDTSSTWQPTTGGGSSGGGGGSSGGGGTLDRVE